MSPGSSFFQSSSLAARSPPYPLAGNRRAASSRGGSDLAPEQHCCEPARVVPQHGSQPGRPSGQSACNRWAEPAYAFAGLIDLATRELMCCHKVNDYAVYNGADRLHEVVCERAAVALVGVHDPHPGIEAVRLEHDLGFSFENRVRVVHECLEGGCRLASALEAGW